MAVTGTVKREAPSGTLVASIAQSSYGEDVTFTANFTAAAVGTDPMTGTVAFYDGTTYLGTEPLASTFPPVAADTRTATPLLVFLGVFGIGQPVNLVPGRRQP